MSALYKHKHHIVPKHAGGSDDPSNFIELTIEEHAEAHRILFEEFGRWQDRLAWQTLSGQITNAEANIQATKLANTGSGNARYGKPGTLLGRKGKDHPAFGKKTINRKSPPRSEETKQKIRITLMGKKHPPERIQANRLGQLKRYGAL